MPLIHRLSILMICLATIALGIGYAAAGYWPVLPFFAFTGGLWLGLRLLKRGWIHSLALMLYTGLAAFGVLALASSVWMLLCLAAAVAAWDLEYFLRRLESVEQQEAARLLAQQHLRRLAVVSGLGLLLAGAAMAVEARFTLGAALVVGLLAIVALGQVIGFLRRESD